MNEGNGLVSKIDQQIAELQALRAFAVKNFPDDVDTAEPDAKAKPPRVTVGVKKKATKPVDTDAASVRTAILEYLEAQSEPSKAEDVAPVVGISGGELTAHLRDLAAAKEIRRTGAGRGTRWSAK